MKEAFELIVKRLKEKREYHLKERARNHWGDSYLCLKHLYEADAFAEAIEIVKQVVEEYGKDTNVPSNDGWIPTSERMPEEEGYYLVSYGKDTQVYVEGYNGKWFDEHFYYRQPKAWTYCPEPYQPKGE